MKYGAKIRYVGELMGKVEILNAHIPCVGNSQLLVGKLPFYFTASLLTHDAAVHCV